MEKLSSKLPADFSRAREKDPFKQAENVSPKSTSALPRMEENTQAPTIKALKTPWNTEVLNA